jgi:DedD protein
MARNVSDEELQLKKRARRRLVGAIVLVTAVAVVLPMILESEPKPASQNITIQIPSPEAGVLTAKPAPLKPVENPAPAAKPQAETKAEAKPAAKIEPKPQVITKTETKPVAKTEPKTQAATPAPAKPVKKAEIPAKPATGAVDAAKTAAAGDYVIQVVALADAARAKDMHAKITAAGLKAYTEVVQTANGPVTRVRVGPYPSREAAEQGRTQLQRLQLDGKVIPR